MNGVDSIKLLKRIGEQHGPLAVMLVAVSIALHACVIAPFQDQQALMTETNRTMIESTLKQSERLANSVEMMASSQSEQITLLNSLNDLSDKRNTQILDQIATNRELLKALQSFAESVMTDSVLSQKKLDMIIEATKKPD